MPSGAPVPVVCAIILDSLGRLLVSQRPAYKHLGGKWEFPGGKVEPGERPEHALAREIQEELACDIIVERPLPRFTHDYGTVVIEMLPYVCRLSGQSGPPHAHEHASIRWVTLADLQALDLAPAYWPVVKSYVEGSGRRPDGNI